MTDETKFGSLQQADMERRLAALERRVELLTSETAWVRNHRHTLFALVRSINRRGWVVHVEKPPGALRKFINRMRGSK